MVSAPSRPGWTIDNGLCAEMGASREHGCLVGDLDGRLWQDSKCQPKDHYDHGGQDPDDHGQPYGYNHDAAVAWRCRQL